MKEKTGVTLIALIITIIVMLILAGVSISVGTESIRNAQRTKFDSELRVIHIRVNEILEEMSVTEVGQMLTLNEYDYNIPSDKNSKAITALGSSNLEGYWYFNKAGLEKLGVSSIDREVLINFTTKDIVDLEGIDSNGEKIYRLLSWRNEEYIDKTANAIPSFTLSKKIYGLNATIIVNSLNYGENVSKGSISYCLLNQDGTDGELRHISGTEIPVSVSGTYKVIATNSAGKSSSNQVNIALTNQPKLDSGMVPVVYVEAEPEGYWEIADENGGLWYDYAEDKAMWANVMLLDDLTVEGGIPVTAANKGDMVGKKVTTLGSMFVWIPRYMYKIPYQNFHTSNAGEIDIKFLKGTTNIATDNTHETIANPYGNSIPVPTENNNPWIVHPAFTDGSKTNYTHGGWDSEITGIWVAKFEASSSTPNATNGGGNDTSLNVKVLPNVPSWRNITADSIFTVCQNMNDDEKLYGLSHNSDPHMMKNTEWGVVTYLTQSRYGYLKENINGNINLEERVWTNPNSNYITGQAGSGVDANAYMNATTSTDSYNIGNGPKASTTGNVYGIYDFVGGANEYVAAYITTNYSNTSEFMTQLRGFSHTKYVEVYSADNDIEADSNATVWDKRIAHYSLLINGNTLLKWGDGIYETSRADQGSSKKSWYDGWSVYPYKTHCGFARGATNGSGPQAGIFSFDEMYGGEVSYKTGFHVAIIVN